MREYAKQVAHGLVIQYAHENQPNGLGVQLSKRKETHSMGLTYIVNM